VLVQLRGLQCDVGLRDQLAVILRDQLRGAARHRIGKRRWRHECARRRLVADQCSQSRGYLRDPRILGDAIAALGRAETPAMVGDDAFGSTVIHLSQARSNPAARRGVGGDDEPAARRVLVSRV
jgi:hypothetical protein